MCKEPRAEQREIYMPNIGQNQTDRGFNQKGFTLVEVMIGMAIFVIGYLAVGSMQMLAINGNANARKTTEAATLAADRLESLIVLPYENIDSGGPVTEGAYTVVWQVDNGPLPDTKAISVIVSWQHRGARSFEAMYIKTANM